MNSRHHTLLATVALALAGALFSPSGFAQDTRHEDMVKFFQMPMIDKNKDGMVSKQEFLAMMAKAWDFQMASSIKEDRVKARDKMTLQEYQEFAKMFGLNVGS